MLPFPATPELRYSGFIYLHTTRHFLSNAPVCIPKHPPARQSSSGSPAQTTSVRVTSLANPVAQTFLATHVERYWGALLRHYRQSR